MAPGLPDATEQQAAPRDGALATGTDRRSCRDWRPALAARAARGSAASGPAPWALAARALAPRAPADSAPARFQRAWEAVLGIQRSADRLAPVRRPAIRSNFP